ncbi:hypothetical protein [Ornithinimicrobium kibberense]|uniref:hypothetical protein n=1 Tax=Ornithinimicrobium kibberense TaxID=282060 RepID=UPI003617E826
MSLPSSARRATLPRQLDLWGGGVSDLRESARLVCRSERTYVRFVPQASNTGRCRVS